jgi:DNA repair protein RadD
MVDLIFFFYHLLRKDRLYQLRPYQTESVEATLTHFRRERSPAVLVLPTGAGKSLVIAELARLAKGRVLVMAHVRELVEQNYAKFLSFGLEAGIYSAGLNRKDIDHKVIFGSIQSIARAGDDFFDNFSLVVIDECHRISLDGETQYLQVINQLQKKNSNLCVLGLTATPYRMGLGWIYQYHEQKKIQRTEEGRFFNKCIYELSIRFMIKNGFLTQPIKIDSPVACYDFTSLKLERGKFMHAQIEEVLKDQKRITPLIIKNIIEMSEDRNGVMIFTSSVNHAVEIMQCLPAFVSALVTGETPGTERDDIIVAFKKQKLKFLVNVSVLTTGFDAPHVDVIAILRPTESVSLYQQIVGRGLRLSPGKSDCLILDFTGQGHDLYSPLIEDNRPNSLAIAVEVICPKCGIENQFWGIKDAEGVLVEHYGRQCQGALENLATQELEKCGYRFRFKRCDQCGEENDIAARSCAACKHLLVDNDQKLKEAMSLKDAHVMRVETMVFESCIDKKGLVRLEVHYFDADAEVLKEYFYLNTPEDCRAFYFNFTRMHLRLPCQTIFINDLEDALRYQHLFRAPMFVIARKQRNFWSVREKIWND